MKSSRLGRFRFPVLVLFCLPLVLTGCGPNTSPAVPGAPTKSGAPTATVQPSITPPDDPIDPPPTSTSTKGDGCPSNDAAIPAGADTATIEDVDGDGQPDIEFYSESPRFEYGIQTASGATIILPDELAGAGRHSGWSARLENQPVVTVLDDSRSATLHAFIDCSFVTTQGVDGKPYRFSLNGFSDVGTGVQCSHGNGGRLLLGVLAAADSNKRYTITQTVVIVSKDGTRATNEEPRQVATDLSGDSAPVVTAMGSHCGDIPKVTTSGW